MSASELAVADCFSATYAEARDKFLSAARQAGAQIESYAHPLKGPGGGDLATDVARLGPAGASRLAVVSSATHGVEGYCGSGIQVGLLRSDIKRQLPGDTAILFVHAHNPHGFAHDRRVTEDNVDLNRNFRDFDAPAPVNAAYAELHPWLVPEDWDGPARAAADKAIAEFIEAKGIFAYQAAVFGGQYDHADGLFFGGFEATWSNRTIRALAANWCGEADHIALLDLHTGLGPRGFGELIAIGDAASTARAKAWYGDEARSLSGGESVSAQVQGTMNLGYEQSVGEAQLTAIAIEYGTLPQADVLQALRADNWLHLHGDVASEAGRAIKQNVRDAFYGDDDQWKSDIWTRALDITRKALAGLAAD
jgi:hypothetical protein